MFFGRVFRKFYIYMMYSYHIKSKAFKVYISGDMSIYPKLTMKRQSDLWKEIDCTGSL